MQNVTLDLDVEKGRMRRDWLEEAIARGAVLKLSYQTLLPTVLQPWKWFCDVLDVLALGDVAVVVV